MYILLQNRNVDTKNAINMRMPRNWHSAKLNLKEAVEEQINKCKKF